MSPRTRRRLSAIILAFRDGVPEERARALVEELRRFPAAVSVEPSDTPEAECMVWFRQTLVIPVGMDEALVFTPDPWPSVKYLRRTSSGLWRLWYPGDAIE